jgi:Glycosyl hydrolase family 71
VLTFSWHRRILLVTALASGIALSASAASAAPSSLPAASVSTSAHVPVFAYYYMWMTPRYWRIHKKDHPVKPFPGNYDSANPAVINWQIQRAQAAGISGFLVSWKNNATYQRIMPRLEKAANQHNFKLAMTYESLTLHGGRLPASRVGADMRYFVTHYAGNAAWYRVSGKPLTVWSGTDGYSPSAVARVTRTVRSKILVLNSASTVAGLTRLAPYTDGDAYYWSSINPVRNPFWALRLALMGAAESRLHGIWVAPFAPGFDARLLGGHNFVNRDHGLTLRLEYRAAAASEPTILGLISWNEWTENTYMEPSLRYASRYLNLLKGLV